MDIENVKKQIEREVTILSKLFGINHGPHILVEYFNELRLKGVIYSYDSLRSEMEANVYIINIAFYPGPYKKDTFVVRFPMLPDKTAELLYG